MILHRLLLLASLCHSVASFTVPVQTRTAVRTRKTSPYLGMSTDDEEEGTRAPIENVRFLGRGKHAIVRPGVVLIAPPDEFHHFLRKAAVFIYAMGLDDDDVYVVRGVIIDHPTPFTIQEMMSSGNSASTDTSAYLQNLLYRGGELGDAAFMLHSDEDLGKDAEQEMIGTSGIYQGGLEHAVENGFVLEPSKAKFFFSYMEFTENELDEMLENRENESTQWVSVEVAPDFVLSSEWERGEAWSTLRNAIRER